MIFGAAEPQLSGLDTDDADELMVARSSTDIALVIDVNEQ